MGCDRYSYACRVSSTPILDALLPEGHGGGYAAEIAGVSPWRLHNHCVLEDLPVIPYSNTARVGAHKPEVTNIGESIDSQVNRFL
jgi:hypothetical protein